MIKKSKLLYLLVDLTGEVRDTVSDYKVSDPIAEIVVDDLIKNFLVDLYLRSLTLNYHYRLTGTVMYQNISPAYHGMESEGGFNADQS